MKNAPQGLSQGQLEEDGACQNAQELKGRQSPPAQAQAVPGQGGGGEPKKNQIRRNRGGGTNPAQGP